MLGSYIVREFLQEGHAVRALRRPGSDMRLLADVAGKIEWVEGDLFDTNLLSEVIEPSGTVVHAAALVSFAPARRAEMFKTNVEGTANVVNVCLEKGVRRFCHVSSVAALGRSKNRTTLDETAAWEESEFNTTYAQTKHLAELEVWRGVAEDLPAVVVNPSVVLGPGDWHRSSTQLFRYAFEQKIFYPPGQVNYVDVRDVARAIFLLARTDIIGERFILNAGTASYRELLAEIARRFGKKPPKWEGRPWMLQLAWRAEWLRGQLTGRDPLVTRETARTALTHYTYQNNKVRNQLAFAFRSLSETLDWTCGELIQNSES